jgi:saccharopine dehydrogenase-like NADP-dependent oxidoreductase
MQNLLILGAGRSASSLISFWCKYAEKYQVFVSVADPDIELALSKVGDCTFAKAISFDVNNHEQTAEIIKEADLVISMLPAHLHIIVLKHCLNFKKNLLTASYASNEIKLLHQEAVEKGILVMMECGLDPGIDHMSAMKIIHDLKSKQAEIISFKSYCGGLVAPESDTNPWHYKFSWNPRNVILAGQGTAQYLENGELKYIPYQKLFSRTTTFDIPNFGKFEGYANRDSLSYMPLYGLESCQTFVRGTLRGNGYCDAWALLVKLGLTDDSFTVNIENGLTWNQLVKSFLPVINNNDSLDIQLAKYLEIDINNEAFTKILWLDILSDQQLTLIDASPAKHLQQLLEEKWKLQSDDKDMIVMVHEFEYVLNGIKRKLTSSLKVIGDNQVYTAMAKTVGLPLALASKMILAGKIKPKGVVLPIHADIYEPILNELVDYGIEFIEKEI